MRHHTEILDPHNWAAANLQNGDIFINKKLVSGVVLLSAAKNEIYENTDGDWLMTFEGYKACNKVAGVQIITPESLILPDGRVVSNPYSENDPKTNSAFKFIGRCVSFGKNTLGKLHIEFTTIIYDAKLSFIEDLSNAMKKNKDIGRYYMDGTLTDEEMSKGIFYLIDGDMGIWADRSLPEVTNMIQKFITSKKNGDKQVITAARKAALQRQPSMPHPKVKPLGGLASILVGTHIIDLNEHEIKSALKEYAETGNVSGADVSESSEDISKAKDVDGYTLLSEGGRRF